jgi:hypothetical protein
MMASFDWPGGQIRIAFANAIAATKSRHASLVRPVISVAGHHGRGEGRGPGRSGAAVAAKVSARA